MSDATVNTIEYLVLLVSEFAHKHNISEAEAYVYLDRYGAIALCERNYGILHMLSVDDNVCSLTEYCRRKGGTI